MCWQQAKQVVVIVLCLALARLQHLEPCRPLHARERPPLLRAILLLHALLLLLRPGHACLTFKLLITRM